MKHEQLEGVLHQIFPLKFIYDRKQVMQLIKFTRTMNLHFI